MQPMPKSLVLQGFFGFLGQFFDLSFFATFSEPSGLEPCTTELDDRFSYKIIKPNENIVFETSITVKNVMLRLSFRPLIAKRKVALATFSFCIIHDSFFIHRARPFS